MKRLLILFSFAACAHTRPGPTNPDGAAPVPITCASVCDRGATLGCLWAQPTAKGHSCEQVCHNAANAGQPWALECIAKLTTCDSEYVCP